jgi:hypothetical protein
VQHARLTMFPRIGANPEARAKAEALLSAACADLGLDAPQPMRDGAVNVPRARLAVNAAMRDAGDRLGVGWDEYWFVD